MWHLGGVMLPYVCLTKSQRKQAVRNYNSGLVTTSQTWRMGKRSAFPIQEPDDNLKTVVQL